MDTGREKFKRNKKIIKLLIKMIAVLPKKTRNSLLKLIIYRQSIFFVLIRYCLVYTLAKKCGDNVYIGRNVSLKNVENIEFGNNVSIHENCYIDAAGEISIGNDVSIAHNVSIISFNHSWEKKEVPIKYNELILKKIHIDNDVWIGAKSTILAGTHIEERVVVAANAVVNKNVKKYTIVGGIPAKEIKKI